MSSRDLDALHVLMIRDAVRSPSLEPTAVGHHRYLMLLEPLGMSKKLLSDVTGA